MTRCRILRWILAYLLCAGMPLCADEVDFNRDIRPIFTKHCTACHGGVKAAGGISFVIRERAMAAGESGERAIVPGSPQQSEILRRIRSKDPDVVMPQPKHGPPLSSHEADLIEKWIAQGAEWKNHWAFEPPVDTVHTKIPDDIVPLDAIVSRKFGPNGVKASPPAPPEEWLRRTSFDLTGMPPDEGMLADFRTDWKAGPRAAKERVVDRLLASPRYGERWASVWLDLARYSDTYGFEKDPHREIWPYRDWVIRAFNQDMPFDRFTIEQLAGDLLPDAGAEQRLATAFHRNTQTNTEGGTDDEEYRVAAVIDRVNTTWTTWQATTFGCAQCHDHPYDPITQKEYYQFMAFFDSTLDHDLDDDFPKMKVAADPADRERVSQMERAIRASRDDLHKEGRSLKDRSTWLPFEIFDMRAKHGILKVRGNRIAAEGTLPVGNVYEIEASSTSFTSLLLEIFPESDNPAKWPERGSWVSRFEVWRIDAGGKAQMLPMADVFVDFVDAPLSPAPQGNVGGFPKIDRPRWAVFVPEAPFTGVAGERIRIVLKQSGATSGEQATPLRLFALHASREPHWTTASQDSARKAKWRKMAEAEGEWKKIPGSLVPIMSERPMPRDTRLFTRGNRLTKDSSVSPGTPIIFGAAGENPDRLAMARWLVGKSNPLTARVLANTLWAELFGEGIVVSQEDFGSSGEPPSDLILLDHLALRLRDHHRWSVKGMLREIVLSETYGRTHRATPDMIAKDPHNRLLARGPRVRLTAEMLRDQALAVSGLISTKMFGPPVYPPQPDGVWRSVYSGAKWKESQGEDRYRRAVYTYSKRTSGYPAFLTFDAPSRDLCSARRIRSNTPLQALVALNDPAHIECARGLAARMAAHSPVLAGRISYGIRICGQRDATPRVLDELSALHADALAAYTADPKLAAHLGDSPDAAALVLVANTILNLDSSLNR